MKGFTDMQRAGYIGGRCIAHASYLFFLICQKIIFSKNRSSLPYYNFVPEFYRSQALKSLVDSSNKMFQETQNIIRIAQSVKPFCRGLRIRRQSENAPQF